MKVGDKFATAVFWLLIGGIGLLGGGWVIYATLENLILSAIAGRDLYPDSPDRWPLFWGSVVIFALSVLGIREGFTKILKKRSKEDAA